MAFIVHMSVPAHYYTSAPLSALHSLQQLQAGASSPSTVQISGSTHESIGTVSLGSVSCPQVTDSAISPQVQASVTRFVTSDVMSATLAEAATQLSFAEYLESFVGRRFHPTPARGVLS